MKIRIIKIYTESFVNVFTHTLDWTRVTCGPLLVGAIGAIFWFCRKNFSDAVYSF